MNALATLPAAGTLTAPSEAAALEWRDVAPAATPGALRITVRPARRTRTGRPTSGS